MLRKTEIHILDGNAEGCHECNIKGWTGLAYRIPRELLPRGRGSTPARKKYEEACPKLRQGGIYFLLGRTKEKVDAGGTLKRSVYVGKADPRTAPQGEDNGVLFRALQAHKTENTPNIDEWDEVVMLVSIDEDRQPLDVARLEKKFIERLLQSLDSHIYTAYNDSKPRISEKRSDESLDDFVEFANRALIAFGHYVLEPMPPLGSMPPLEPMHPKKDEDKPKSEIKKEQNPLSNKEGTAHVILTSKGFVLQAGSLISPKVSKGCPDRIRKLRREYAGHIRENTVIQDISLRSLSEAAQFVCGYSESGPRYWCD